MKGGGDKERLPPQQVLELSQVFDSNHGGEYRFYQRESIKALSGQSYKQFTLVNYDCRVVLTRKYLILRLESRNL